MQPGTIACHSQSRTNNTLERFHVAARLRIVVKTSAIISNVPPVAWPGSGWLSSFMVSSYTRRRSSSDGCLKLPTAVTKLTVT